MAIKNVFSTAAIFIAVVLSGYVQTSTGVVTTPLPSTNSNNTNTTANLTFSKVTTNRESALNSLITSFNPTSNQTHTTSYKLDYNADRCCIFRSC